MDSKKIPTTITRIIIAIFILASSFAQAQTLPTTLTSQQQKLIDERAESDKKQDDADKEDLITRQAEDVDDPCATSYQGEYTPGQKGGASGGGTATQEVGDLVTFAEGIFNAANNLGETLKEVQTTTGGTMEVTKIACEYVKSIKRISKHFEDKTFMYDPAARRKAARDTETYKFQVINMVKKGHAGTGENGATAGKMYPENTQEYIDKEVRERTMVELDNMQKIADADPNNTNLQGTINSLRYNESLNLESRLKNTLTPDRVKQAFDSSSDVSAQERDAVFLEMTNPESNANPYSQFLTASLYLQNVKEKTEQNIREELLAGNGFLNNRECAETTDGASTGGVTYCKRWVTVTPGSIISGGTLATLNSRLQQYEQADTEGKLTSYAPSVNELSNMSPEGDGSTGGYGSFDDYDGDGIPNWQDTDKDGDGVPDDQDPTPYLSDGDIIPAKVSFTSSKPTEAADSKLLASTLTWSSEADYCLADNNWISANASTPQSITAVKTEKERLPASGTTDIKLPLNFEAKLVRIRGGATATYPAATATDNTRLGTLATLTIPSGNDGTATGDKFQLQITPYGPANTTEITVPEATGTTAVLNLFKNALTGKFKNFVFGYQSGTGKITLLAEPSYQISCINTIASGTTSTTTKKVKISK